MVILGSILFTLIPSAYASVELGTICRRDTTDLTYYYISIPSNDGRVMWFTFTVSQLDILKYLPIAQQAIRSIQLLHYYISHQQTLFEHTLKLSMMYYWV